MSPSEIVKDFLAAWGVPGAWRGAIERHFASDCLNENVGLSKTIGPAEAIAFVEAYQAKLPWKTMDVEIVRQAAEGNLVMTERIDRFPDANGNLLLVIPVMGVFEIRDGKICLWRDYFDLSGMTG